MSDRLRVLSAPLVVAVTALAIVGSAQESPPPQVIARIAKSPAAQVSPDVLARLTPLEELETAWIARAPADVVRALRSSGVDVEELPTPAPGFAYYLVFDVSPTDAARLRERGPLFAGDDLSWLLLASEDRVRDMIPSRLSFKRVTGPRPGPVTLSGERSTPASEEGGPRAIAASSLPAELAGQVSRDRLQRSIAELEGFVSRYASTASCEAAGSYLLDYFRRLGLDAAPDYFTFGTSPTYTTSNIVATLPGRTDPGGVVIVSAHYDSFSDARPATAPGADDNASGTAAVMEAALLLAPHAFDFTVRFIAFGAEEWGLLGSQRYAQAARQRGERIVAVLNLDMIGYADRLPEDLDIVSNEASAWLADRMASISGTVAGLPTVKQVRTTFGSDCSPFWQQGFASLCGIEDNPVVNPYYHKVTDRVATLNMDLATAITRATVATLAEVAQPVSTPATPTGLVARSQVSTSLFMRGRTVTLEWRGSTGATGYNVYRAATSHGTYRKLNPAPLRQNSYGELVDPSEDQFYVVTALDATGRESNYSPEASVPHDPLFRAP